MDALATGYAVVLWISVHFTGLNKGFDLTPELIGRLAALRVTLRCDLYSYGDADE